ncbi:multidrug resistance-associated protein 1 [Trichonephila clavipes]|nr:multidrug resistance-associated protein 1 [Trichonephila clavipes]
MLAGTRGSVAFVPQVTWVLNRTLRDNILLVKHMVEEKYNKVLDLCCLRPDLEILPAGDLTEIGEKGVNLSGGQKLRVHLAQAVYQDKDIYLDVIGNTGLLGNKTRILVTHDVSVLQDVDLIVSMKDGEIDEIGSYNDLMNKNGSFASFVEEHSNVKEAEEVAAENGGLTISRLNSKDSAASKDYDMGDQMIINAAKCLEKSEEEIEYRLTDDERMEVGGVHRLVY